MTVIARETVALALGVSAETLPPGDLPLDRFATRLFAFLRATEDDDTLEAPADLWCAVVQSHLAETDPASALAVTEALVTLADSPEDIALIATGPLDELLTACGPDLIAELEQAAHAPRFAYALSGVALDGAPALFRARLHGLATAGDLLAGDPLPPPE